MDPAIKKLFAEYEAAFAALDVKKQVGYFADTFISAGPAGAITRNKAEFLKMADNAAAFYRSVGQTSARILRIEEVPISSEYSMVKTHW